jgi:TRAP-type mannitol/chloroaromatic compound transport system substrate-binding protein
VKRREVLRRAAAGAVGAALAACGRGDETASAAPAVHTAERVQWRLASSFPRGLDTIWGTAETVSKLVAALSGGRFTIRSYPAGEIVPGLQVLDAVQQGTVHVGQTASYYYVGKNPAFAFDTALPFGLSARQQAAWILEGGGRELLAPVFADFGMLSFFAGSTGAQMGGWFRREIGSVADLQGLKMRIPGLGGDVMSRLGATVQVLAGGDIYPALERGAIDATEWIGPYDDEKLGFHKVAKFYYYPGWWEPGPGLSFLVNRAAWDGLSDEFRAIFETAALTAGTRMQAQYDARNGAALARLLASGVELRAFPDDVMKAARDQAEAISAEHAAADPRYAKILTEWKKYRDESFRWFGTTELAYAEFSFPRPR